MKQSYSLSITLGMIWAATMGIHHASGLEVELSQPYLMAPGGVTLSVAWDPKPYSQQDTCLRIAMACGSVVLQDQCLDVGRESSTVLSFTLPNLRQRATLSYVVQLCQREGCGESRQVNLEVWPQPEPPIVSYGRTLWVYDPSGKLPKLFDQWHLRYQDALSQSIRAFGRPDLLFVGENLSRSDLAILEDYLANISLQNWPCRVIWFRQGQNRPSFNKTEQTDAAVIQIASAYQRFLLRDLKGGDIRVLLLNRHISRLPTAVPEDALIEPVVFNTGTNDRYLTQVIYDRQIRLYCQIPLFDGFEENPVRTFFLRNMIQLAVSL